MFTIRMAEKNIQINNRYDYIKKYCRNYIVDDAEPDIYVDVSEEEISAEACEEYNRRIEYLETLAVYRKICEQLVNDDIILVHSSVLMVDGKAVMFLAPSGTGKSTHAGIWRKVYGDRVTMINDDKPLVSIKKDDNGMHVIAYGTPWCGKHGIENNTNAPVKAIFILNRSGTNYTKRLSEKEAFPYIYKQIYHPNNEELMKKTLPLMLAFAHNVEIYELGCNMEEEATRVAYKAAFGADVEVS